MKKSNKFNAIVNMDNDTTYLEYLDLKDKIQRMLDNGTKIEDIELEMNNLQIKKKQMLESIAYRLDEDTKEMTREVDTKRMFKNMNENISNCIGIIHRMSERNEAIFEITNSYIKDGEK